MTPVRKAAALALVLFVAGAALPAGTSAQAVGNRGVQADVSFMWESLVGGAFPNDEIGLGITGGARYLWPNGLSVGVVGLYAEPEDLDLPNDDRRRLMEEFGAFAEARYQLARLTPVRPYLGGRVGFMSLQSENVSEADGTGVKYGLVAGTEIWPSDRVGGHVSAVVTPFSVSDFVPDRTTSAVSLGFEVGVSVFLGSVGRDTDRDGVRDDRDECPGTRRGLEVGSDGCPVDTDYDGVPDYRDECPETLRGVQVNRRGCPMDTDGDGVADGPDACPETPEGARVDEDGCALDTDGDGVPDGVDRCPETPEGREVTDRGCLPDGDDDGVPDGVDRCSGTLTGASVDEEGCSRVQAGLESGRLTLGELPFRFRAVDIREEFRRTLDRIGQRLAEYPELRLEIQVHTDALGPEEENRRMTQRLAEVVKSYIVRTFPQVSSDRLEAVGYGESEPVAPNDTAEGRAQNRRVEFVVIEGEGDGEEDGGGPDG